MKRMTPPPARLHFRHGAIGALLLAALCVSAPSRAQSSSPPDWDEEITAYDARRQLYLRDRREGFGPHATLEASRADDDPHVAAESAATRVQLGAAIATFERFAQRHPDDPAYTPAAVLRLAELYHDLATLEAGAGSTPQDERCAIAAYRIVLSRFPADRLRDTTLYLLGWALAASGRTDEALGAYRSLVCSNLYPYQSVIEPVPASCAVLGSLVASIAPASSTRPAAPANGPAYASCESQGGPTRYAAEVWYRIGDLHFDDASESGLEARLSDAIAAYRAAIRMEGSTSSSVTTRVSDRARYKIAWSFHRMEGHEPDATLAFAALLDSLPPPVPETAAAWLTAAPRSTTSASDVDLSREAIEWLAAILHDADWEVPSRRDQERCQRLVIATAHLTGTRSTRFDCAGILRVTDPRSMERLTVTRTSSSAPPPTSAGGSSTDHWWTPFVWLSLARNYFDQTAYPEAITLYTLFLRRFPAHVGASIATQNIAIAVARLGRSR